MTPPDRAVNSAPTSALVAAALQTADWNAHLFAIPVALFHRDDGLGHVPEIRTTSSVMLRHFKGSVGMKPPPTWRG